MTLRCPYCRRELDLSDLQEENDITAIIRMVPAFGQNANLVWAYVDLFGISPLGKKAKKARHLFGEMKALFDTEEFSYNKKRYKISRAGICEALNTVVKRNFETPLDSHNYLKRVMIGISEREFSEAGREAEKELRRKEEKLMSGERPLSQEEIEANKKRLREMITRIGN